MYTLEQISKASNIYVYLQEHGELSNISDGELYNYYNEEGIGEIVKTMGKESRVSIEKYNGIIYFIPDVDNRFLGFKKNDVMKAIFNVSEVDRTKYYLSQYIILIILTSFYSAKGNTSKGRYYITLSELEAIITTKFEEAKSIEDVEGFEDDAELSVVKVAELWESATDNEGKSKKWTRRWYVESVCKFLQSQNLVTYMENEDTLYTSTKLDNLMDYSFLNLRRLEKIQKLFEEYKSIEGGEANA